MSDIFHIGKTPAKWKEVGSRAVLIKLGEEWIPCNSIREAKAKIETSNFMEPRTCNIEYKDEDFQKLAFAGREGLELIAPKIDQVENAIFEKAKTKLTFDKTTSVKMWRRFNGSENTVLVNNTIPITCMNDLDETDLDDSTKYDIGCCLDMLESIPEGECWNGRCFYRCPKILNNDDILLTQTAAGNNVVVKADDSAFYNTISNSDFGILFDFVEREDGTTIQNIPVDNFNTPTGMCVFAPAVSFGKHESLSHIQALVTSFQSLKGMLLSTDTYENLVGNSAFKKFLSGYGLDSYLNEESFYDRLVTFIDEELKAVKELTKSALGIANKDEVVVAWENSLTTLNELVKQPEVILNMITAFNDLTEIKECLYELFQDSCRVQESKEHQPKLLRCNKTHGRIYLRRYK